MGIAVAAPVRLRSLVFFRFRSLEEAREIKKRLPLHCSVYHKALDTFIRHESYRLLGPREKYRLAGSPYGKTVKGKKKWWREQKRKGIAWPAPMLYYEGL
jgi:hypothetical protein